MLKFSVVGLAQGVGLMAVAAASLLPATVASAQTTGEIHAWPVHLQHMKPTDFVKVVLDQKTGSAFLLPSTAQAITPDDSRGDVIVEGDETSARQVMEMARLLDVVPKEVKMVVRFTHAPDADQPISLVQPVLAVAVVQVKNNEPIDVEVFADRHLMRAHLIPHINGDNSVSLASALTTSVRGEAAKKESVGATWYHRTAGLMPSDLVGNGGKVADPAQVKTVSYAPSGDGVSTSSLPPKGEYAISVAPILAPAAK